MHSFSPFGRYSNQQTRQVSIILLYQLGLVFILG
jgi:hypothetical protein